MKATRANTTLDAAGTVPNRRDDLECHELDDEAVLFDKAFANTYRLNATAYLVWRACDGVRSVHEVAHELTELYGVAASRAVRDVLKTIDEMTSVGLVVGATERMRWTL